MQNSKLCVIALCAAIVPNFVGCGDSSSGNGRSSDPSQTGDGGESNDSEVADEDAGEDADGGTEADAMAEAGAPFIDASMEVQSSLCSNEYENANLSYDKVTRGSWQFNPGGNFIMLEENGYPCRAFLADTMRPSVTDPHWTNATDSEFVGFSETSTISETGYMSAQFRYFRTFIFVPESVDLTSLTVKASGIDDALYLSVTNSEHPDGVSPTDAGPSDPDVGACSGNGQATWDLKDYMAKGEINVLLLVHADMRPMTSSLTAVEVRANDEPVQIVSCEDQ